MITDATMLSLSASAGRAVSAAPGAAADGFPGCRVRLPGHLGGLRHVGPPGPGTSFPNDQQRPARRSDAQAALVGIVVPR